jgi:hypothetical protein
MNVEEKAKVTQLLAVTAAYYRQKLEDEVLKMYAEDLIDLPFLSVSNAIANYRRNPKNRTMPLPAQVRDMLTPVVDPDAMAREIAGRCVQAITKFGWPQPGPAREFIGEEGWSVIESSGGWLHFVEQHGDGINPQTFFAQARDRIKDQLTFGRDNIVHGFLDSKKCVGGLQRLGELFHDVKRIDDGSNEPA